MRIQRQGEDAGEGKVAQAARRAQGGRRGALFPISLPNTRQSGAGGGNIPLSETAVAELFPTPVTAAGSAGTKAGKSRGRGCCGAAAASQAVPEEDFPNTCAGVLPAPPNLRWARNCAWGGRRERITRHLEIGEGKEKMFKDMAFGNSMLKLMTAN